MILKSLSIALVAGMVGASLTACGEPERFVLKADDGQIGSDATITMEGKTGRIHFGPLQGFPEGMDQKVTEIERIDSPNYRAWKVQTEQKMTFSFLVVAGAYICESCAMRQLPLTWHPQK